MKEWPAATESWTEAVRQAVKVQADGFFHRSALTVKKGTPSRSKALLRSWIYRDVHVRAEKEVDSFLSYDALPVSTAFRQATVRTSGWRFDAGSIVNEIRQLSLMPQSVTHEGFVLKGDKVELPRLRCGTSPGWLTVAGLNGEVPRHCYRLYLPGIRTGHLEALVKAIDLSAAKLAWSLKSSIGVDRDGAEILRADQTVIYVAAHKSVEKAEISDFLDVLGENVPVAAGPGFSVELRPGVYFGGKGNEYGSFGTRIAGIAADALLHNDFSPLMDAERNLTVEAMRFERGE